MFFSLMGCALDAVSKNLIPKVILTFSFVNLWKFYSLDFTLRSMIHFELIFVKKYKDYLQIFVLLNVGGYTVVPTPQRLFSLCTEFQRSLDCMYVSLFMGSLLCLIFVSFLSPVLHCLDNCSFKLFLEIRQSQSSDFVFLNCLVILGLLPFHTMFKISLPISTKKIAGIF